MVIYNKIDWLIDWLIAQTQPQQDKAYECILCERFNLYLFPYIVQIAATGRTTAVLTKGLERMDQSKKDVLVSMSASYHWGPCHVV